MAYEKTTWARGDVVTSAKLNKIENGLWNVDNITTKFNRLAHIMDGQAGYVLTRIADSNMLSEWKPLPDTKVKIIISPTESAQIYALVEQLKAAADSAGTKTAAMGVPFNGTPFLENLMAKMSSADVTPVVMVNSEDLSKIKLLCVCDVSMEYGSFGYTETSTTTLYEVRFFVNATSLIIRVTSCPFSIVGE